MKRILLPACLLFLFMMKAGAQSGSSLPRPKLVVGLVIDQMRWDYLYRYYDRYGTDGFKRLMKGGYNCQNTMVNYLPSFTAPGHSCIYTGSVPSIHGIAGNDWTDNGTGRHWYCVEDTTVEPVGGSRQWGQMSPRNLMATTVTDELRLATNFKSRVYGISLKDRSSILPAGHLASGAYWFDDVTGNFFTSTYYAKALPGWLNDFNARRLPDSALRQNWHLLHDPATYAQSLPDNNRYEGLFNGEKAPVFPHITEGFAGKDYNALRKIPAGNAITLKLARACINGTGIGQTEACDFLCVSLSATDYAGHQYGPNAVEMEDMYLRLDEEIASFLRYLDNHIGPGNYLLFLTADHGAAHNAGYLEDLKIPSGNLTISKTEQSLNASLKGQWGQDSLVRSLANYQVTLNEPKIISSRLDRTLIKKSIRQWLEARPETAYVMDMEDQNSTAVPEPVKGMAVNGYYRQRSGCMQVILKPGWYAGYGPTGTTHGTWNPYDTHIPLLWYGWHIPGGESYKEVHMTDIAATVSALLHIQMPNGCIGKVIPGVVK